jgi:hypothetical protein
LQKALPILRPLSDSGVRIGKLLHLVAPAKVSTLTGWAYRLKFFLLFIARKNRNWAHSSWGQRDGASTDPCSEAYKGAKAASAVETQQLAAFINKLVASKAGAILYTDWHSYSQLFMTRTQSLGKRMHRDIY